MFQARERDVKIVRENFHHNAPIGYTWNSLAAAVSPAYTQVAEKVRSSGGGVDRLEDGADRPGQF